MNAGLCGFASGAVAVPALAAALEAFDRAGWLEWLEPAVKSSLDRRGAPGLRRSDLLPTLVAALAIAVVASPGAALTLTPVVPFGLMVGRASLLRRAVGDVERSLPAALIAVADSMAAGASLEQAAAGVGRTQSGLAFARFAAARVGGADLDSALGILAGSDREATWAEVTAAISLRRRCGGDLASALRAVGRELDETAKAKDEARGATAQARFTANLVCCLPLVVGVGCEVLRPGSVATIASSPLTLSIAGCALVLQVVCLIVIRRVAEAVAE
ncbi:MAG: hypothetical protein WCO96_05265 [Actinomycetes bacterium]